MSANQAMFPIATMARVLGVSPAGYYAWLRREPSARARADVDLSKRVRTIHAVSRGTYGAPRIHAELQADGQAIGRKRVARLMRVAGLAGASRRRGVVTTRRNPEARPAPDLVDRNFAAERPNQLWVADITFVPTLAGFLYLAVVLPHPQSRVRGSLNLSQLASLDRLIIDARRTPRAHEDMGRSVGPFCCETGNWRRERLRQGGQLRRRRYGCGGLRAEVIARRRRELTMTPATAAMNAPCAAGSRGVFGLGGSGIVERPCRLGKLH